MQPFNSQPPLEIFDLIYGRAEDDSIIALGSRRPIKDGAPAPHYLFPVRVADRYEMLPGLFEYCVEQTQYLMPNTLHESALLDKADEDFRVGLDRGKPEYFAAQNKHVRELCALYVDLDVGRPGELRSGEAIGAVLDRCFALQLPTPSLAALSGRGVYLLWLLRDEKTMRPPPNTQDNRQCWKLIESEICLRLKDLKADRNATRPAQWLKRPGTIDTKTGLEVIYMTFGLNDLRNVPLYRLSELMQFFELHHTPRLIDIAPARREIGCPESAPLPKREPQRKVQPGKGAEPWKKRADEIERISQFRRGIPEGLRSLTLFHYFQNLFKYLGITYKNLPDEPGNPYQEATAATLRLNQTFRPPLPEQEVLAKICTKAPVRVKLARNDTIAESLGVTENEVRRLQLESIIPGKMKTELETQAAKIAKKNRQLKEERRKVVDKLLTEGLRDRDIIAEIERLYPLGEIRAGREYVSNRRKELMKKNPPWDFYYSDPPS